MKFIPVKGHRSTTRGPEGASCRLERTSRKGQKVISGYSEISFFYPEAIRGVISLMRYFSHQCLAADLLSIDGPILFEAGSLV